MTKGISIRWSLTLAITALGIVGVVLALWTVRTYATFTVEHEREELQQLVHRQAQNYLEALKGELADLAFAIQNETEFKQILAARDVALMEAWLDRQFERQIAEEGLVNLQHLAVFDAGFVPLGGIHAQGPSSANNCGDLIARARTRGGEEAIRVLGGLCAAKNQAYYYSVVVPVGGMRPIGYLQVSSTPAKALTMVNKSLNLPVRIVNLDGDVIDTAGKWPAAPDVLRTLIAQATMTDVGDRPALLVVVADDITSLHTKLQATQRWVLFASLMVTLFTAILALLSLQLSTVRPLRELAAYMRRVRVDKDQLGERVAEVGSREIRALAHDLNEMSGELQSLYNTMEHIALTDALTRLPNRLKLQERLNGLIGACQQHGFPFALIMMDLDRFKNINDTLGHVVGDKLLQEVGHRLMAAVRTTDMVMRIDASTRSNMGSDMVARLGGDEFAAIFPMMGEEQQAVIVARNLSDALAAPFVIEGHNLRIKGSMGIALFPLHGDDTTTLMRHADVAMYEAKNNQHDYAFYDATMDDAAKHHLLLEQELRRALEDKEFVLFYQPQITFGTADVIGAEALIRWKHPERGMIYPDTFIPVAERIGLIQPMTLWVVDRALGDLARWRAAGHEIGVAVNLSAVSLLDYAIVHAVSAAIARHQVRPQDITLEITEGAMMKNPQVACEVLNALDSMGVRLALDDFGTGYSALTQLKRLPLDEIKIDKSFVMGMLEDPNDAVIVSATLDISRRLGFASVAEGVETQGHWEALRNLGVDYAQGYLIARPMADEAFLTWLGQRNKQVTSLAVG